MTRPFLGKWAGRLSRRADSETAARLSALEAAVEELRRSNGPPAGAITDLQKVTTAHGEGLASHAQWLADLERWVTSCVKTLSTLGAQPQGAGPMERTESLDITAALRAQVEVWAVMDWIERAADVGEELLISVVVATRNRPGLLPLAVASVLGQSYQRFEIVVVDDSDTETGPGSTEQVLSVHDDPRIRVVRTPARRGAAAAFNAGLDAVNGDVITALDDDNVMHPHWLRSIAWAFGTFEDVQALYGARTIEDRGARDGIRSGGLPMLEFFPYVRHKHEHANYIDRNVLAYRCGLADLRYDEDLPSAIDWDHSLRMFQRAEPLALPAIACYYRTAVTGRVTDEPGAREGVRIVRKRAFTRRPMRVLVHTAMYPVISETYIGEDIEALQECGAEVHVSAIQQAVSYAQGAPPVALDVEERLAEFAPDVVLMHWSTHAESQIPVLERHNQPFACRVHSFEQDPDQVKRLMDHPLNVAVFAHETDLPQLPAGVHEVIPTVGPWTVIPAGRGERSGVVSVSAGLPKKDFPLLVEAMAALPDQRRTIILASSNGFEHIAPQVVEMAARTDSAIDVRVDVPRAQALEALAGASVMVYTLSPDTPMGMPSSIVEAMLCGTIVVAPDHPAAHHMVGPDLRTYTTAADIVAHVREVGAGGREVDAARERLRQRAQRYRDPAARRRIHDTLFAGIEARYDALV
jgi:glycosyltransferase involved in cell wall biosynthesis